MTATVTRTFRSGNSEAIRLPKGLAFGADIEVTVVRSGDVLTVYPTKPPVSDLVAKLARLAKPPAIERRDEEPLPEPPGL